MTRIYLPATRASLALLAETGMLGPAPLRAHAVTEALRAALPDADEEELEYAALCAAALHAVELVEDGVPARRMVVAADVDGVEAAAGGDDVAPTEVSVPRVVPARRVASVHVDGPDAEGAVAAARAAAGTNGYDERLEACLDHELEWYATQELGAILDR